MLNKKLLHSLRNYGIFFGIVSGFVVLLIVAILLVRSSWHTGLSSVVQNTLNESYPDTYTVDKPIAIPSAFSTSMAAFSLIPSTESPKAYYGIILRATSLAGAVPVVFLCEKNDAAAESPFTVSFAGYAIPTGKAKNIFEKNISIKSLQYWEKQIVTILGTLKTEEAL